MMYRMLSADIIKYQYKPNLKCFSKNYKEEFKELVEKLPIARFPNMRAIVVPEFNMPGGRSRFFRYIWNIGTGG